MYSFKCYAIAYVLHLGGGVEGGRGVVRYIEVVLDYDSNCRVLVLVLGLILL
jgi:hypothetical protein